MKIGLFIDVDGVCTDEPVNLQYARLLGIETEHLKLEKSFNTDEISTEEFGRRLVESFRSNGFTKKWAVKNFENVRLRVYSNELFKIFEDVYIVSSAPSYFIEPFAKKFSIPEERIICSEYEFDNKGLISKCSYPVSATMKGDFVKNVSNQYQINIGIGDIPEQDAAFLSHCNIRILMQEFRPGYLSVREIAPIISLLRSLKRSVVLSKFTEIDRKKFTNINKSAEGLLTESTYDKNIFIMIPFREDARYRAVIQIIKSKLNEHGFKGWIASDRKLHDQLWLSVEAFMAACKYGIAIFTRGEQKKDKMVEIKPSVFNPNVSLELGFMLSRGKEVLILKDKALKALPTDVIGSLYEDFDLDDPIKSLPAIMERWITEVLKK